VLEATATLPPTTFANAHAHACATSHFDQPCTAASLRRSCDYTPTGQPSTTVADLTLARRTCRSLSPRPALTIATAPQALARPHHGWRQA